MHGLSVNEPVLEHEGVDSVLDFGSSAINCPFHEKQVALAAPKSLRQAHSICRRLGMKS